MLKGISRTYPDGTRGTQEIEFSDGINILIGNTEDFFREILQRFSGDYDEPLKHINESWVYSYDEGFEIRLLANRCDALLAVLRAVLLGLADKGGNSKDFVLFINNYVMNFHFMLVPRLVEDILEVSRQGVQVFIATNDYIFAKYFEVRRKEGDSMRFYSIGENSTDNIEHNEYFRDLKNNYAIEVFDALMDDVFVKNLGD